MGAKNGNGENSQKVTSEVTKHKIVYIQLTLTCVLQYVFTYTILQPPNSSLSLSPSFPLSLCVCAFLFPFNDSLPLSFYFQGRVIPLVANVL